jgi:amiloride-sensitive sodium channel
MLKISGERKLKFFASYTKALCESECYSNFTVQKCGCSRVFMPRADETRICNWNDTTCILDIFYDFQEQQADGPSPLNLCNCLPPCTNIEYSVQKHQTVDYSFKM